MFYLQNTPQLKYWCSEFIFDIIIFWSGDNSIQVLQSLPRGINPTFEVCVLQILYEDPSGNSLRWQRLSDENYHSNELYTCLPPRLKSADNVYCRDDRLTTSHVKNLIHMYLRSDFWNLLLHQVYLLHIQSMPQ